MSTHPRHHLARLAALAWLLMGVTSAAWGVLSLPRLFIVRDDAAATAKKILQAESLYRTAIAGDVLSHTLFLLLGLICYQLLKDVQRAWARAMVALVAVGAAVGFVNDIALVAPLVLLRGASLESFTPAQLEQASYACLRLQGVGNTLVTWFRGLWLVPFGMLIARSGFFPRVLGPLVIFAGLAHALYALVLLITPAAGPAFFRYVTQPSGAIGELPMLLWLLFKGAGRGRTELPQPDEGAP